jgi:pyroglutamyl-peptidase
MRILVTGFKPFLSQSLNPSELISSHLPQIFKEVHSLILPVEFESSFVILKNHLDVRHYDYLIMLGQASGRSKVCFEKIALNWVQTEYPDEAGQAPAPQKINPQADLALMSSFPIDEVYQVLKRQNFEVDISFSAGTYVCNDLYFRVCDYYKNLKSVFIHVPLIYEQVNPAAPVHFLELNRQKKIIEQVIRKLI